MDFTFDEEQQAISELADRILTDQCSPETLRSLESQPLTERLARDAWDAMAKADLLGLAIPISHGGSGRGITDAALVAEQVGRHVALVPYWTSTAALLALTEFGTDEQIERFVPGALSGSAPLTVGLWEPVDLEGTKSPVPWGRYAAAAVVSAGPDLVLVPLGDAELTDEEPMNGEPASSLQLRDAKAERLGGPEAVAWLQDRVTLLLTATMLGVCEQALALTSAHVTEREQFGSPLGTFQAVAHRCADAYIDTEAVRLTQLQAAWQLDSGLEASDALAVATFWAVDGGHRVVHAAQHLHGGVGVDIDFPVHRYFRWAKVIEAWLGGPQKALHRLGKALATS